VRDFMQASTDEDIMAQATTEDQIVISADTDFDTLLALRSEARPSVVHFGRNRSPSASAGRAPAREPSRHRGRVVTR
jgi:hypothetical protein